MTANRVLMLAALVLGVHAGADAQLASRPAADWVRMLDSPERIASLRIDEVVSKLQIQPGDVVADLGAGAGAFSGALAAAVGPAGKVYAVEIESGLLEYIDGKMQAAKITNVHTVLGKPADPGLPASDVDLAFFHDVLHHVEDRATYLENVARYLKPGGRIAVIELDAATGAHRNQKDLQITKEQLRSWMNGAGLVLVDEIPLFTDGKWFVVYEKARPAVAVTDHVRIRTYPDSARITPEGRARLVIEIEPRPRMHVYAPGADGYKVIALSIADRAGVKPLPMTYPESEIYVFQPLNERIPVYQKPFTLVQELVVDRTAGSVTVDATLDYQACDDQVCFSPVSVPLSWTLRGESE